MITIGCGRNILGPEDDRLEIKNESSLPIYTYDQFTFPDTTIALYNPSKVDVNKVLPHGKVHIPTRGSWESTFAERIPSGKLMIFIYDAKTLETTPWDTVRKKYLILKRYDLTLKDLESLNWTVTYP